MDDIYDLLEGRPLTRESLYQLQKDPRSSGLSPKYDAHFSQVVERALQALDRPNDHRSVSVPKAESRALNVCVDDELDFDFIVRAKMDPRYSSPDPCKRDHIYTRAVNLACEELAAKAEQAQ